LLWKSTDMVWNSVKWHRHAKRMETNCMPDVVLVGHRLLWIMDSSLNVNHDYLWSILIQWIRVMIARWQSDLVNTKKAYVLYIINLITRTKEQYIMGRWLMFCGTVHYLFRLCHHTYFVVHVKLNLHRE